MKTILSRAQKENNYEIMSIVGLCTLGGGLRRGELCGLKMSDCHIYEEKKYIQIQRKMVQVKGGYVLKDCKTDNSEREFLLETHLRKSFSNSRCYSALYIGVISADYFPDFFMLYNIPVKLFSVISAN